MGMGTGRAHALVVDVDEALRTVVAEQLADQGYEVTEAAEVDTALRALGVNPADLMIVDVGLPDIDGVDVVRALRRATDAPLIVISTRGAETDRITGLDAGADDYVVKPFAAEELLARVRALLRRGREPTEVLACGDLVLDLRSRSARRGDRELVLSERETDLLELLLRNQRTVVTRELALARVWGSPAAASRNVVDRYVSYLRRKLGEPPLIETVRGTGFVLGR
jgi:two-component system response regulator MprA